VRGPASWLARWLGRRRPLAPEQAARLAAWRARPAASAREAIGEARLVLVDVETSGLDPRRDRLIAVGAVAVVGTRLEVGRGFEVVLREEGTVEADAAVLIHGIAPGERSRGEAPVEALLGFLEYAGKSPLVAFHAPFDRAVLRRAVRAHLGLRLPNRWLDLAWLAPALYPRLGLERAGLDPWLEHFGLRPHARHRALGDALVTGELFLVLLRQARGTGVRDLAGLLRLARAEERASQASAGVSGV
jgi:DNA polymerase-3 subunit epsilon